MLGHRVTLITRAALGGSQTVGCARCVRACVCACLCVASICTLTLVRVWRSFALGAAAVGAVLRRGDRRPLKPTGLTHQGYKSGPILTMVQTNPIMADRAGRCRSVLCVRGDERTCRCPCNLFSLLCSLWSVALLMRVSSTIGPEYFLARSDIPNR